MISPDMQVDSARCPHCETMIDGDEVEKLPVGGSKIAPMGMGKSSSDVLYVCPSCHTILG